MEVSLKIELPCDPAVSLLGIYLKECKSTYSWDTNTPMFIATLFSIAKIWNEPRCPSTDEWIKKMWHTYPVKYYSVIKKMELHLCRKMDWTRDHQVKQNKPDEERQIAYVLSHMQNLVLKNKWQQCKTGSVWGWVPAGGGRAKGEGEAG
jgi:hypothetical protein